MAESGIDMVSAKRVEVIRCNPIHLTGFGYLAGSLPETSAPDSPDGRFRVMNSPARGRVVALERGTLRIAGSAISKADGTWRIEGLPVNVYFLVVGFDDQGNYNAAAQDWVLPAAMDG